MMGSAGRKRAGLPLDRMRAAYLPPHGQEPLVHTPRRAFYRSVRMQCTPE